MAVIRKNVKFEWTDACEQSFQDLKKWFEMIRKSQKEMIVLSSTVKRRDKG